MKNKLLLSIAVMSSLYAANNETSVTPPSVSLISGSYDSCINNPSSCQNIFFTDVTKGSEDFRDDISCIEAGHDGNSTYTEPSQLVHMSIRTNSEVFRLGNSYNSLQKEYITGMKWYGPHKFEEKFKEFLFDTTGEIVVLSRYNNAPYGIYLTEQVDFDKYVDNENFRAWYDIANTRLGILHDATSKVDASKANGFSDKNNILFKNQALYKNYALYDTTKKNAWSFNRTGSGTLSGTPISYGGNGMHIAKPQGGLSKCYFVNMSYYANNNDIKQELQRFKYANDNMQNPFQVATQKGAENYYYYTIDNNNIGKNEAPYLLSVNTRPLSMRNSDSKYADDRDFTIDHSGYTKGSGRFGLGGVVGKNIEEFYKKLDKVNADVVVKFYPDADESEVSFKNAVTNEVILGGKKYPSLDFKGGELEAKFKSKGKYLLSEDRVLPSNSIYDTGCNGKWGFCGGNVKITDINFRMKRFVISKNGYKNKIGESYGDKVLTLGSTNSQGNYGATINFKPSDDMKCKEDQIIEISAISAASEHHPYKRSFFDVNGVSIVKGTANPFVFVLKGDNSAATCDKASFFDGKIVSVWNDDPNTTPLLNKGAKKGSAVYTRVEGEKVYVGFLQDTNDAWKVKFITGKPDTYLDANGNVVLPDENGFYTLTKGTFVYNNLKSGVYSIALSLYDARKLEEPKVTIVSNDFSVRPARLEYNIDKDFSAGKGLKAGGTNKDLDIKLFDSKNNASKLNNLSLNKANLKVQSYEFKLENGNKQVDENNSIKIDNSPISLNFNYPFASKATIILGNDYVSDAEPICRTNSKVYNYNEDNKLVDGKVACNIPSQSEIPVEFLAQELGDVSIEQRNNTNSNAVIFTDYPSKDLKDKVNALVLTGYIAQNGVVDFAQDKDFKYVYREFYEPRDIRFDLKFDNSNEKASARYISNLDSNIKRSNDLSVKQKSIVYDDTFGVNTLNDKFNNKLKDLYNEYKGGKKLSEIASKYEGKKDFYAVTLALAYSRNYDNSGNFLSSDNDSKKMFNLTNDSKITVKKGTNVLKEYALSKQPFVYGEVKIKDLKGGENLNDAVELFYYDGAGKKKLMNDGVIKYTKGIKDILNNLKFTADYDSVVNKTTGKITKPSLNAEYVKDLIRYYDENSDLNANGSFTVEFR